MIGHDSDLTREQLLHLLSEVGQALHDRGREGVIYVVGGAAMALEFDARRVTRDVDAAIRAERDELAQAAAAVAERHGLSPRWLNTTATAFMTNETDEAASEVNVPGLRILLASAEHLLAMKLRSMRPRDLDDLDYLFRYLGLTDPHQAVAIHDRLFDESYIGSLDPDEALYAARNVFERAKAAGFPIGPESGQSG